MNVKAVMKSDIATLEPGVSAVTAMGVVVSSRARQVPVVERGKLIGVVSEWDLLRAWVRKDIRRLSVRDVMTGNVHSVSPDEPIDSVAARLLDERVGCLPVVREGRLLGIVTTSDVLAALEREISVANAQSGTIVDLRKRRRRVATAKPKAAAKKRVVSRDKR